MDSSTILLGVTPFVIIVGVLVAILGYGYTLSENSSNEILNMSLDDWSCDEIESKIKFIDENGIMGYDSSKVIKSWQVRSAEMECGF